MEGLSQLTIPESEFIIRHDDGTYTVKSGLPEFGYELIATLPLCWHLHKKGLLRSTESGFDTNCLYWFSPSHIEVAGRRSFANCKKLLAKGFPNINIHRPQLDWEHFSPPPLKEHYKSKAIRFSKPVVVVMNRLNDEWGHPPINYLTPEVLSTIFRMLSHKYQVVYVDTDHFDSRYEDHAHFRGGAIADSLVHKEGAISMRDIKNMHPSLSINELQLHLYAGCERFISSNGGLGILASYFGGENIISTVKCHEINPDINSFYGWYNRFSKSAISVVNDERELTSRIYEKWVKSMPLFNILIRTSNRPNYFHDCIASVLDQDYSNFNIIVGFDSPESEKYILKFPCARLPLERFPEDAKIPPKPVGENYGIWFPFNSYFNQLLSYVAEGFVLYLDDDDCMMDREALRRLAMIITEKPDCDAIFWRVKFPKRLVPSETNWQKKRPICNDISTIGFLHSTAIKPIWEPWKRGDFRVADYIYNRSVNAYWLDAALSGLQRKVEDGYGKRDDKQFLNTPSKFAVSVVMSAFNASSHLEASLSSILAQESSEFDLEVHVGIDGCPDTKKMALQLQYLFRGRVRFWNSLNNVGPYLIKNSLLKKIAQRNGLVLFFDADDILPPGLLAMYLNGYIAAKQKNPHVRGIHLNLIDFPESMFDSEPVGLGHHSIVDRILQSGPASLSASRAELASRFYTMRTRYSLKNRGLRPWKRFAHGIILTEISALEMAGGYNNERVGMDTDLMQRLRKLGCVIVSSANLPWFIRRVHSSSLTQDPRTGIGSQYRRKVDASISERLESGLLVSDWETTELYPLLD